MTAASLAEAYGERTVVTLREFRGFAAQAARLIGRGRPAFDADEMLRLAGDGIAVKLGAAVARMDERFVADHPELSLRVVKHLPHLVTDQDAIRPAIVWNALERELPVIDAAIGRLLDE